MKTIFFLIFTKISVMIITMIITTNIVVFEGDPIEFCEIVVEDGLVKLFVEIEIVVSEDDVELGEFVVVG